MTRPIATRHHCIQHVLVVWTLLLPAWGTAFVLLAPPNQPAIHPKESALFVFRSRSRRRKQSNSNHPVINDKSHSATLEKNKTTIRSDSNPHNKRSDSSSYSLGMKPYIHPLSLSQQKQQQGNNNSSNNTLDLKQLRPMIKFFSDDITAYSLGLNSHKAVVTRNQGNWSDEDDSSESSLDTRVVKFEVDPALAGSSNISSSSNNNQSHSTLVTALVMNNTADLNKTDNLDSLAVRLPIAITQNRTVVPISLDYLLNSIPLAWNSSVTYSTQALSNMSAQALLLNMNISSAQAMMMNTTSMSNSLAELLQFMQPASSGSNNNNEVLNLTEWMNMNFTTPLFQLGSLPSSNASSGSIKVRPAFQYSSRGGGQSAVKTKPNTAFNNRKPAATSYRPHIKPAPSKSSQVPVLDTAGKSLTDVLTVEDLDKILKANGYVRQSELENAKYNYNAGQYNSLIQSTTFSAEESLKEVGKPVSTQQYGMKSSTKEKGVAFPQPSVLSFASLKWGTTASSTILFIALSTALLPNLWLVGAIAGAMYGYDVGKQLPIQTPNQLLPSILVRIGTRLATTALKAYDFVNGLFFMWKTGVLSYEYWKRYANLDQKFKIQDKVDAWNSFFIEGKDNFDRWEQENEVGRKVLATLRTAWLVEERSLKSKKRRRGQSKYRLVQLFYDSAYSLRKLLGSIFRLLTGGGSEELTEVLRGIRIDISQSAVEGLGARLGAVMAALIAVNVLGALFTISSTFSTFMAVLVSLIWPTWITEFSERMGQFLSDTRAVGRGENVSPSAIRVRYAKDRKRYHYYINNEGKKRYYRVGKPIWPWLQTREEKKKGLLGFFPGAGGGS